MSTEVGRRTFRAVPGEVRRVREWLRTLLGAGCDDALECLSEIFTNAVLHTASGAMQGPVSVVVTDVGSLVHIEVTDAGGVTEPRMRNADERAQFGRGLFLVNALTCGRWGWENELMGRRVWFEVPR